MKLKLIFLLVAVFLWRGTGFCAGDITGNPQFGKTSGWRSLTEEPVVSDYSSRYASSLIDAGTFPITYSGKTGNTLTGVNFVPVIAGDTIYDQNKHNSTVTSVTSTTITLSDASSFSSSGSLVPFCYYDSVDMGATEYIPPQRVFH